MSLNIKNKKAHQMASQLARLTGESMTQAVTEALRERLERVRSREKDRDTLARDLVEIGKDIASRLEEPYKSADHADLLYDENGLPK